MNIFYLDTDPKVAAQYHCDKHIVKMILEYAQLLSTAHFILDNNQVGYKPTHKNHPSAIWVRESTYHYMFLVNLLEECSKEYQLRYGKVHKTFSTHFDNLKELPSGIIRKSFISPPQCMPDKYKCSNTVDAYRNYYIGEKYKFAKWKNNNIPPWFKVQEQ